MKDSSGIQDLNPVLTKKSAHISSGDRQGHNDFWLDSSLSQADITMSVPDACIDEFDTVLKRLPDVAMQAAASSPNSLLGQNPRKILPRNTELADQVRQRLESASGAVLLDRFPAIRYSDEANRAMCGLFSALMAPLMRQNPMGTVLHDVMDEHPADRSQSGRSSSYLPTEFHTDGGWASAPARYVGLYCIRAANAGGYSRITSLLCACEALLNSEDATAVTELTRAHPWDRQGEHGEAELPYEMQPMIERNDTQFLSRFCADYIVNGYRKKGETISEDAATALTSLQVQLDKQPSIRFLLRPGQYQYVNNHTIASASEAFEDSVQGQSQGRRLIRVWNQ